MRSLVQAVVPPVCLLLLAGSSGLTAADPPKIERIVPAGAQLGTTAEVKLSGKPGDGSLGVWSDHGQLTLEISEKNDTAKVSVPADAALGCHWLRFYNQHGATDLLPFVVGTVTETAETEPNNTISDAQLVATLPTTINGVLEKSGDVDLYACELKKGRTFVASVTANKTLGSPMDSVLQLLDASGTVVAQNDDDHGFDPQIVFPVPADGRYIVRIFAFPATPNSTIRLAGAASYVYRLAVTNGPFVDYCMPAVVTAGVSGAVVLHGWNLGQQPLSVDVPPFQQNETVVAISGGFPLTVYGTAHPTVTEATQSRQNIEVPSALTGVISTPGETDTFVVSGTKGQQLTVSVAARAMNSLLDPVVTVSNADGKVIKESDDRSREDLDAEAAVKLPADGDYTVSVRDRYGSGGERFVYVMTCREPRPAFALTLKGNVFVSGSDKVLEIPVAVTRTNGFAEKIQCSIDGLPAGVSVEPVVSEAKGETAKTVTLKISQGDAATAFSGNIRIEGTAEETRVKQTATAPVQNSPNTTTNIWLTVIAPPKDDRDSENSAAEDGTTEPQD